MIRLSRLTDYAVTLLAHMGQGGTESLWAASDLAHKSGLPMPTAAKILKMLAKTDLISAQRGAAGGYRLARPMLDISIADIIEAMDGPIAITDCAEGSARDTCKLTSICPTSRGWQKVNIAVRDALQNVTLAELVGAPEPAYIDAPAAPRAATGH